MEHHNADCEIYFPNGIYGFEELKRFAFSHSVHNDNPFKLMVSVDKPEIGFIIISPFDVLSDYDIEVDDSELSEIGIHSHEDIAIYCITVVRENKVSVNLKSPVIFSNVTKKGMQIITDNNKYSVRHIIQ